MTDSPRDVKPNSDSENSSRGATETKEDITSAVKLRRALLIEEQFINNQIRLAQTDSISLAIDLVDSVALLLIRGVPVRKCTLIRYSLNSSLQTLQKKEDVVSYFAEPFTTEQTWSTVPKVPYQIKKAPKDTIEAQRNASDLIVPETADVFFTLGCDRNLLILFHQSKPYHLAGLLRKWWIQSRVRQYCTLYPLFHFQWPRRYQTIDLEMSQEDAKAILRALPEQGYVILRLL